ncbi:MAG: hypothetical protein K0V04_07230 [Deltaproteobacteria bacterium]|nr:hypothetical protein [Deltaproteobacteria bacterium]
MISRWSCVGLLALLVACSVREHVIEVGETGEDHETEEDESNGPPPGDDDSMPPPGGDRGEGETEAGTTSDADATDGDQPCETDECTTGDIEPTDDDDGVGRSDTDTDSD